MTSCLEIEFDPWEEEFADNLNRENILNQQQEGEKHDGFSPGKESRNEPRRMVAEQEVLFRRL